MLLGGATTSPQKGGTVRTGRSGSPGPATANESDTTTPQLLLSGRRVPNSASEGKGTPGLSTVTGPEGTLRTTHGLSGTFHMLLDDQWDAARRLARRIADGANAEAHAVAGLRGQLRGFGVTEAADEPAAENAATQDGAQHPAPQQQQRLALPRLHVVASDAEELARSVGEVRQVVRDTIFRLENTTRDARRDAASSEKKLETAQARCQLLHKEVASLRHELEFLRREEERRGRRAAGGGGNSHNGAPAIDVAASGEVPTADQIRRLRKEASDLREQLVVYEGKSLDQAADMAAALTAAANNQTAVLKLDELRSTHEALEAKYRALLESSAAQRSHWLAQVEEMAAMGTRLERHRDQARRGALHSAALAAGVSLGARVFHAWAHSARHRLRESRLSMLQSRADSGARMLAGAEGDLAALKLKFHKAAETSQEELDRRRVRITALEAENAALAADVRRLSRLVGGAAGAASAARGTTPGGGGGGGSISAQSSMMASPSAASLQPPPTDVRMGGAGGGGNSNPANIGGEAQHIEALEAYNFLFRTLRSCRDRLHLKCLPVMPLQMHEQTTSSVTGLVIAWVKRVARGFSQLFALDGRVGKLRTRLVTISVATRAKIAVLAVKLSLPIGTLEGQVVRSKKAKYEELITRIQSLRAKIETARTTLFKVFDVKDTSPCLNLIEGLEGDVAVFARVLRGVEAAQFAMSLQLTKARIQEAAASSSSPPPAQTITPVVAEDDDGSGPSPVIPSMPPPSAPSTVLSESKRLVDELRSASAPPGTTLSAMPARHGALTPLEDRSTLASSSVGHMRMIQATGSIATRHSLPGNAAGPAASSLLRKQVARRAAIAGGASQRIIVPANGFAARGGAVIPFRAHKGPAREADVPKHRVRLAEELLNA